MPSRPIPALALASTLACALGTAHAADGPRLPWADPIGVPPTFGTASPSLPHAEPIGASRLQAPGRHVTPRTDAAPRRPLHSCYRVRERDGRVRTYCQQGR